MGLHQFSEGSETLFIDMATNEYKAEIANTYNRLRKLGVFDEIDSSSRLGASMQRSSSKSDTGAQTMIID